MSRSSAKERGRVRTGGRAANTLRVVENFGSWKHEFYAFNCRLRLMPYDRPTIIPLSRRFIGGENRGRKLTVSEHDIYIRKPTERMLKATESYWLETPIKLITVRKRSNYPNRKKFRRMNKELAMAEVSSYLEDRREMLEAEQREALDHFRGLTELEQYYAEQERSAELAELERSRLGTMTPKHEKWGYHHYF